MHQAFQLTQVSPWAPQQRTDCRSGTVSGLTARPQTVEPDAPSVPRQPLADGRDAAVVEGPVATGLGEADLLRCRRAWVMNRHKPPVTRTRAS